ncbi:Cytochrome bd ubiquinol oxidase, 14kDa subunit [Heracleum sosnowskyi]|uniref:Cytochrome bd ubiquinol oxidase, 14kDa subunit n=1 Tax=Heracleum sosnowskyi TaxID=360622 RepID=A0AAD8HPJ0_9APIA|nr:Cytochrome bd ubiquinol oxidase, 14kDa subunit [Heracleum sosnowskyi]
MPFFLTPPILNFSRICLNRHLFRGIRDRATRSEIHKKSVETRIRKYGLRYDDIYDPQFSLDIKEALDRLPTEVVDARNQRLKRCMDLSMKHSSLPKDLQQCRLHLEAICKRCWLLYNGRTLNGKLWVLCPSTSEPFHNSIVSV